ncbi:MAG: hypothetical protein M3144_11610, partial [Actinomycetota bacterium]|nr:hypothetical protein [Actinomycetota bacterium]
EWNRAVVAGILFLAAEIGLATVSVLERLRSLSTARAPAVAPDPEVLGRLRETAPPRRDHFAWLSPRSDQLGVFVPVLMGMGVVVSAAAWLVERLSRATAQPVLERRLASRLAPLSWPAGSLVPHGDEPAAILSRPVRR